VDGGPCKTSRCAEKCMHFLCTVRRSGFSEIRWSSALRTITKWQARTVVWKMGLSTTIGAWPTLCVSGRCNGFVPHIWEALVPLEVGVRGNYGAELAIILKPNL